MNAKKIGKGQAHADGENHAHERGKAHVARCAHRLDDHDIKRSAGFENDTDEHQLRSHADNGWIRRENAKEIVCKNRDYDRYHRRRAEREPLRLPDEAIGFVQFPGATQVAYDNLCAKPHG